MLCCVVCCHHESQGSICSNIWCSGVHRHCMFRAWVRHRGWVTLRGFQGHTCEGGSMLADLHHSLPLR